MIDKYVEVLKKQIVKLNDDDFDLEAWKSATNVLLGRIFGDTTIKIGEIDKIKYDFGSWSLRDASGSRDQMQSCKKRGRGILEACITELDILGLEENDSAETSENVALRNVVELELKISEYRSLIKILKNKSTREEKRTMLIRAIQNLDTLVAPGIVANLLTEPAFRKAFG